jgi:hypothetical protein
MTLRRAGGVAVVILAVLLPFGLWPLSLAFQPVPTSRSSPFATIEVPAFAAAGIVLILALRAWRRGTRSWVLSWLAIALLVFGFVKMAEMAP